MQLKSIIPGRDTYYSTLKCPKLASRENFLRYSHQLWVLLSTCLSAISPRGVTKMALNIIKNTKAIAVYPRLCSDTHLLASVLNFPPRRYSAPTRLYAVITSSDIRKDLGLASLLPCHTTFLQAFILRISSFTCESVQFSFKADTKFST